MSTSPSAPASAAARSSASSPTAWERSSSGAGDRPLAGWHVVVPVKDTRHGKSRLARAVGRDRADLSHAIATDTLEAVVSVVGAERVILVTADAALDQEWRDRGVLVVPEPGTGLNGAITAGMRQAGPGARVAALLGDLPALDAWSLSAALTAAQQHDEAFVPDADGTGTVLRSGTGFIPRFGHLSADRHQRDGASRLDLELPRLRTDVDDAKSLAVASALGLGRATLSVLQNRASGWIRAMQATVHRFDPETRSGSVLRDDGVELLFSAPAFESSGLRHLRVGQRLTVDVVDDLVVAMRIVGIGTGQPIR